MRNATQRTNTAPSEQYHSKFPHACAKEWHFYFFIYCHFTPLTFGPCQSPWRFLNTQRRPVAVTARTSPLYSGFNFPLSPCSHLQRLPTQQWYWRMACQRRLKQSGQEAGADPHTPRHTYTLTHSYSPLALTFLPVIQRLNHVWYSSRRNTWQQRRSAGFCPFTGFSPTAPSLTHHCIFVFIVFIHLQVNSHS